MAGFAMSPKENRTYVVSVKDKKQFIEEANKSIPSKQFFNLNAKVGKLIDIKE